eukprot:gnl/TRDRNA2_/TRDRNA2_75863_c0_seq2.p1 gnl/TRDRNA2_/TRDRNA2_75863_c0~~gnl/TRDRNA2_/TRDRNA2_75863_c0_seq2.p1  ORF type:complete len:172 (-),score=30.52 gnl/TRDRNA2_/TRDRNA2_75863_c0_seq2:46-561(-)
MGIANLAGGFYPCQMAEFAAGGLDDLAKICGDEMVWVSALASGDMETILKHANTQMKSGTDATKTAVEIMQTENDSLFATDGLDRVSSEKGYMMLQFMTRVSGSPPKESLAKLAPRTFLAGGRFDGMHKLNRIRDMKKLMPEATLEMFGCAHAQVPMYALDKVAAFFAAVK